MITTEKEIEEEKKKRKKGKQRNCYQTTTHWRIHQPMYLHHYDESTIPGQTIACKYFALCSIVWLVTGSSDEIDPMLVLIDLSYLKLGGRCPKYGSYSTAIDWTSLSRFGRFLSSKVRILQELQPMTCPLMHSATKIGIRFRSWKDSCDRFWNSSSIAAKVSSSFHKQTPAHTHSIIKSQCIHYSWPSVSDFDEFNSTYK